MPAKPSPILGGFSTARAQLAADNDAINLAVEIIETKDGLVPGYLFLMSGLILLYTAGSGPIRGMLALNDVLYVVSGDQVYSITANGTVTNLGTVNGLTGPVSMFQNTNQLMILDGVGAWLLPGGYPLTGGLPLSGSLYAVGDNVILTAFNGGTQTAYPEIQITGIANNPVSTAFLVNGGTSGYTTATNVAVTPVQPQAGSGSGLTLNITAVNGQITSFSGASGGTGYNIGDTGNILQGAADAVYQVQTVGGSGNVTLARLLSRGSGYSSASAVPTLIGNDFPPNIGTGLLLNITASGGVITDISLANGGQGFQTDNIGIITGGSGDATFIVNAGAFGVPTSFSIVAGGAISALATSYTQQSTDGSGQDMTVQSPSYGAFASLIPITLPFDDPVAGVVIDGYGLAVFLNQQVIAQSNQQDLSTWPALSFGVANQSPDKIMSIGSLHDEAYIFKERNTENWVNQGTSPFAFGPLQGVHMEFGTCAPFSPSKTDNELIWLARNDQGQGVFLKASAYAPQLISTQALTNELQKYSNIADCIAYSRQEGGHTYYVATFPSANVTWCYDKTSSELAGFPVWTKMAAFLNGALNRHWGNAFTTWSGGLPAISTPSTYTAQSIKFSTATVLQTAAELNGLPSSFSNAVFSVWLDIPDGGGNTGVIFGNQQAGTEPGLQITIQNDSVGAPEIVIQAWDASSNPIVVAHYTFAVWSAWVNVLISIDTATHQLQVYANTLTSNVLVEDHLTATSLVWSSTNPIAALSATPWSLEIVA